MILIIIVDDININCGRYYYYLDEIIIIIWMRLILMDEINING